MTRQTHPMVRALFLHAPKLYLGLAIMIVGAVILTHLWWGAFVLAGGVMVIAYGAVRILRVVQHERPEVAHPIPSDLPFAARIEILRRGLWVMPLILVPSSIWTAWKLNKLETGQVSEVFLGSMIGDVYRSYGFWPAVLFEPVGLVLFELFLVFPIRQLRREALTQAQR